MIYTVKTIEEDLDFGCEERRENDPVMAVVTLTDESGDEIIKKFEDAKLYREKIAEGDCVYIASDGTLRRQLGADWTRSCTPDTVDVKKFTDLILRVKAGEQVDWSCPFCGESVGLISEESNHTVIGCKNCDMRISIDN